MGIPCTIPSMVQALTKRNLRVLGLAADAVSALSSGANTVNFDAMDWSDAFEGVRFDAPADVEKFFQLMFNQWDGIFLLFHLAGYAVPRVALVRGTMDGNAQAVYCNVEDGTIERKQVKDFSGMPYKPGIACTWSVSLELVPLGWDPDLDKALNVAIPFKWTTAFVPDGHAFTAIGTAKSNLKGWLTLHLKEGTPQDYPPAADVGRWLCEAIDAFVGGSFSQLETMTKATGLLAMFNPIHWKVEAGIPGVDAIELEALTEDVQASAQGLWHRIDEEGLYDFLLQESGYAYKECYWPVRLSARLEAMEAEALEGDDGGYEGNPRLLFELMAIVAGPVSQLHEIELDDEKLRRSYTWLLVMLEKVDVLRFSGELLMRQVPTAGTAGFGNLFVFALLDDQEDPRIREIRARVLDSMVTTGSNGVTTLVERTAPDGPALITRQLKDDYLPKLKTGLGSLKYLVSELNRKKPEVAKTPVEVKPGGEPRSLSPEAKQRLTGDAQKAVQKLEGVGKMPESMTLSDALSMFGDLLWAMEVLLDLYHREGIFSPERAGNPDLKYALEVLDFVSDVLTKVVPVMMKAEAAVLRGMDLVDEALALTSMANKLAGSKVLGAIGSGVALYSSLSVVLDESQPSEKRIMASIEASVATLALVDALATIGAGYGIASLGAVAAFTGPWAAAAGIILLLGKYYVPKALAAEFERRSLDVLENQEEDVERLVELRAALEMSRGRLQRAYLLYQQNAEGSEAEVFGYIANDYAGQAINSIRSTFQLIGESAPLRLMNSRTRKLAEQWITLAQRWMTLRPASKGDSLSILADDAWTISTRLVETIDPVLLDPKKFADETVLFDRSGETGIQAIMFDAARVYSLVLSPNAAPI